MFKSGFDTESLEKQLLEFCEPQFAQFSSRLVLNSRYQICGVRIPKLRQIAREMSKIENFDDILIEQRRDFARKTPSFEAVMVHLLAIGYRRDELTLMIQRAKPSFSLIDNWSLCDSFAATFSKNLIKTQKGCDFIHSLVISNDPWESRLGIVMAISFKSEQKLDFMTYLKSHCNDIDVSQTPVSMAIAWVLSHYMAYYPAQVKEMLEHWPFDELTKKRTLQKIRESKRNSDFYSLT